MPGYTLPTYDEMKKTWGTFGLFIEEIKADGKVTPMEIIQLVIRVGGYLGTVAKLFIDVEKDAKIDWAKDIAKKIYHDKDLGLDINIPIIFEPIESKVEDMIIDSIIVSMFKFSRD